MNKFLEEYITEFIDGGGTKVMLVDEGGREREWYIVSLKDNILKLTRRSKTYHKKTFTERKNIDINNTEYDIRPLQ